MKKCYWIAPLVALLVFAVLFSGFSSAERTREQTRIAQSQADLNAKLVAETEARRLAVIEAVRVQAELQKKQEAREAIERIRLESRQQAVTDREQAIHEQQRLTRQLEVLKKELAAEQRALAQLTVTRNAALVEREFLKKIVTQSEANVKALAGVISQLSSGEGAPRLEAPALSSKKNP